MVSADQKQLRIARILREFRAQRREHKSISFQTVAQKYPELMPDLGIRFAAIQANESSIATLEHSESGGAPRFLSDALPEMEALECLDGGAQGYVYKALHRPTKREVAIKILLRGPASSAEQRHRFRREVELVARLRHPNIVRVYDSGEASGYAYIVMEYIQGLRIDDFVCVEQLSVREIVSLFCSVCDAVSAAHSHAVLHRDLKPSNILVDANRQPHVVDFGLAKDLSAQTEISMTGQVVGTLPYLSPDQVRGEPPSVQTDVYSLGVILFELLTGEYPYPINDDRFQSLSNIVSREPVSPRKLRGSQPTDGLRRTDMNADLERIVLKALAKEPIRRYESAAHFAADLRRYLSGDAVLARSASRIYVLRKTVRKFRTLFAALVVCVLLMVGALIGVTAAWRQSDRVAKVAMGALEMASLLKIGSVERDAGRLSDAVVLYDKVVEIGRLLQSDDPMVLRQLCNGHHRLAELHFDLKNTDAASPHVKKAFELASTLSRLDPLNEEYESLLGAATMIRGRLLFLRGEYGPALQRFDDACRIRERLLSTHPDDASLAGSLVITLGSQASSARKLGMKVDCLKNHTRAYEISRDLFEKAPENLSRAIDLARAESKMAIAHYEFNQPDHDAQAANWLEKARSRLGQIHNHEDAEQRQWSIDKLNYEINANQKVLERRIGSSNES